MDHLFYLFIEAALVPMILAALIAWQIARPKGWNKGWRWTGLIVFAGLSIALIVACQMALPYARVIAARHPG